VLLGAGVVVAGLAALGVILVVFFSPGVKDATTVYADNFSSNTGQFPAFANSDGAGAYHQGGYWLTAQGGTQSSTVAIRAADVVDLTATLSLVTPATTHEAVGLQVQRGNHEGYRYEIVSPSLAIIIRVESDGRNSPLTYAMVDFPTGPAALRLTVEWTFNGTEIVGYLNDLELIRYVDDEGWDQFTRAGVAVNGGNTPVTLRVDDVVIKTAGSY
jgi:hypothetical protein